MATNGSDQALKHPHFFHFLSDFGYPAGQLLGEQQIVMKGLVYGVKKQPKCLRNFDDGQPPIVMNGGGDSVDESLCPDWFGLELPLHV